MLNVKLSDLVKYGWSLQVKEREEFMKSKTGKTGETQQLWSFLLLRNGRNPPNESRKPQK